jgi:heme-degrading monooxygenase HmoA
VIGLCDSLDPPFWAVIFTSLRRDGDAEAYAAAASDMTRLARRQPGFLGVETARDPATGLGITVSYWTDEAAIAAWRNDAEHRLVRRLGRERWYRAYRLRVAKVERAYGWAAPDGEPSAASAAR